MRATHETEFIVVAIGGRRFALPASVVETAVAPPPVTPLPFVPAHVEGLVNVNERVLPVISLRRLLGCPDDAAISEIVVVDSTYAPFALRVDAVVAKADVAAGAVEAVAGGRDNGDAHESQVVSARFNWEGTSVLVLEPGSLARLIAAREAPEGRRGLLGRLQAGIDEQQADASSCVVVRVGTETYGIALDDTVEILDLPPATPIPGAPLSAEGITLVRNETLLVLSLASLLRRNAGTGDSRAVVVIDRNGTHYGLRVDDVEGILSYPIDRLRAIDDATGEVSGIVIDGDRVLGLLRAERLLPSAQHASLAAFAPARNADGAAEPERHVAILEVALGDEAYGIPLDRVRRITDQAAAERVRADEGAIVSGAVNIDGNVVPVVDYAALLKLEATRNGRGAWVIVSEAGHEWAIPVATASDILEIPESAIEPIAEQGKLVTAIARVDQRLVSLLSMTPLQTSP